MQAAEEPPHPRELDDAIIAAAKRHGVPEHLVRRIIMRESKYDPRARNHRYWGLMQISYPTAKSMGFKGTPQELLNPVVNLRYAVPYLANAFIIAGKRDDYAVKLYAAGYYFTARTKGLLAALRTADSVPLNGVPDEQPILAANAVVQPPQNVGIFGALLGPGSAEQPQAPTQANAYAADASMAGQAAARPDVTEATVAPAGLFRGKPVEMVADKNGTVSPPRKWKRDGGMSIVARGEQVMAQRVAAGTSSHSRKTTAFASLDLPPSSAQAYASPAAQDPRFAATASQAAIMQATSGQGPAPQEAAAAIVPAPQQVAAAVAADDEDKPAKRKRSRHSRRHKSHGETQVADGKSADDSQPSLRSSAQ